MRPHTERTPWTRRAANALFAWMCIASTLVAVALLAGLLYSLITGGVGRLSVPFLTEFSSRHPEKAGILVFSIPYNRGWSLKIDGKETPMIRANFGMLATPVQPGAHSVELDFHLPGKGAGLLLGALGLALLLLRRRKYALAGERPPPG